MTRSSSAPSIRVRPRANNAATAKIGISSIKRGIISELTEIPFRDADRTRRSATGSSPLRRSAKTSMSAPISRSTSNRPVRVGFIPTLVNNTSLSGMIVAATSKNAAELKSPGTSTTAGACRLLTGFTVTARPSRNTGAPNWPNIRSVWSRDRYGSVIVVGEAAYKAANMIADFTWALATGMAYRIPCKLAAGSMATGA